MLKQLLSKFQSSPQKAQTDVSLHQPSYFHRHPEQHFLILATGPSLKSHQAQVQAFIDQHAPIVMAGNFIEGLFQPQYHAFSNRSRFHQYGHTIHPQSQALLSPYFLPQHIKKHCNVPHELIMFENQYPGEKGSFDIDDKGVIYSEGATIATLMIAVAIVMGAHHIYVAGMDGYSQQSATHHYTEADDKDQAALLQQERSTHEQLEALQTIMTQNQRGQLQIITPTAYQPYATSFQEFSL